MDDDGDPGAPPPATTEAGEADAPGEDDHRPRRAWVVGAGLAVVLALVAAGVILGGATKVAGPGPVGPLGPVTGTVSATASATVSSTVSSGPTSPGVRLTVSVPAGTTATVIQQVVGVLAARLQGVRGASVTRQGSSVVVALPASSSAQQLLNLVQEPGTFEVRPVLGVSDTGAAAPTAGDDPTQPVVLGGLGPDATETFALGPSVLTGTAIQSALAAPDGEGSWAVQVTFTPEAAAIWAHFTGQLACATGTGRQVGLVLDGQVASAPVVSTAVTCGVGITAGATTLQGAFSQAQAQEFAAVLSSGPLPVPISVVAGAP